jgi:hypothetical protein
MNALTKFLQAVVISNNAKLWTNIAYGVATWKIAVTPLKDISTEMFLLWIGIVSGVELVKRAIAGKLGVTREEPCNAPTIIGNCK